MSLNLQDVCDQFDQMGFPDAQEMSHPDLETVKLARSLIEQAIASESFLIDCIQHELRLIEGRRLGSGLIPFYVHPRTGIQFSFGYWAPGSTPGPHVHTAWTLTALCKNSLNIITYNTHAALTHGELIKEKEIDAEAGQVGFIHQACVHDPTNTSSDWSWTLHVTSPRDGDELEALPNDRFRFSAPEAVSTAHPFNAVLRARQGITRARYLLAMLMEYSSPAADLLAQRCLALGPRLTEHVQAPPSCGEPIQSLIKGTHRLQLVDEGLDLRCEQQADEVALLVNTPQGPVMAVQMDVLAQPALNYVAKHKQFDVSELPGELSRQEQHQIGATLETVGLFRSMR